MKNLNIPPIILNLGVLIMAICLNASISLAQSTCATAVPIASFPYTGTVTSCGAGVNASITDPCAQNIAGAEDLFLKITPSANEAIIIMARSTPESFTSISVIDGCPESPGSVCLASQNFLQNQANLMISLVAGHTYYILLSSQNFFHHCAHFVLIVNKAIPEVYNNLNQQFYKGDACGLDYCTQSINVTGRDSANQVAPYAWNTNGAPHSMPTTMNFTCIPNACIIKAFIIYTEAFTLSTVDNPVVTIRNPNMQTFTYNPVMLGNIYKGKCWGELGTRMSYIDVTTSISGNGNYRIDINSGPDKNYNVDGFTLMVIYQNPGANYQGHLIINGGMFLNYDGAHNTFNWTMTGINACANSTYGRSFVTISDMQQQFGPTFNVTHNGVTATHTKTAFWNFDEVTTTVTAGQTSANYGVTDPNSTSNHDCWAWTMAGLYYRTTTCTTCPIGLTLTASPTNPDNCGDCKGGANVDTVIGGVQLPFSYVWRTTPEQTTRAATNLCAGTYQVDVFDQSCLSNTAIVTVPYTCGLTVNAVTTPICVGNCTSISATSSGGQAPVTYTWSSGGNGLTVTVCPTTTTTYTITARDVAGLTGTAIAVVTVNPLPTITVNNVSICPGVSATLTASGAVTYTWNTGPTGPTINVTPGTNTTYIVTGTNASGCTNTAQGVVTVFTPPNITATGTTICKGAVGTITAGGGLTYTWQNPLGTGASKTVNPTANTTYTVTGTDGNGCTNSSSCVVNVFPDAVITATGNSTCSGSPTTLTAGGGVTYTWTGGSQGSIITVTPLSTTTYYVTGTDANGCTGTNSCIATINNNITVSVNNATICNGASATLTATGGNNYTWSTTENTPAITVSPATTTTYSVFATNMNGCTGSATATVTVNQLPNITATGGAICLGASINISAANGTTYTWNTTSTSNPYNVTPNQTTTYTVTGTDNNSCTNVANCTVTVNPLPTITATGGIICRGQSIIITASGGNNYTWTGGFTGATLNVTPTITTTYFVTGTDALGCSGTNSCVVTVNSNFNLTTTGAEICNGLSATVSASGGNTYTWNTGNTDQTMTVTPVTSTTYYVTGTDANTCTGSGSATVKVNPLPTITAVNKTICFGTGTALTATPGNGTPPYNYVWVPGSMSGATVNVTPITNTTYSITVTDSKLCTGTTTVSVIVSPQMSASIIKTDATCGLPNATATVTGSGGITNPSGAPYTYLWSPGGNPTDMISNVASGPYSVTLTDAVGCTVTASVVIGDSPPVTLSKSSTAAACFPNGSATVNVLTGTSPFTYIWDSGQSSQSPANTNTINNINSGTYTVTVTDVNQCSSTITVVVNENNPLNLSVSTLPEHCSQMDGSAIASPSGGNPYSYLWSTGETTQTITNLAQGSYSVTVSYGTCQISGSASVLEREGPTANFTFTPSVLDVFENTTAQFDDLSMQGGQQIVRWHWDFDDENATSDIQTPSHTYLNIGTYIVCLKITDSENCTDSICKPIIVKDIFTVYIPNAFTPNLDMLNETFIPKGYNIDPRDFEMIIFNRWGEVIYTTTDINIPWNGKYMNSGQEVQIGVYVYKVKVREMDGPVHTFIGRVSVIK
ncbi:MAG: gliding motility-associated C-terminal domain-containing protein [Bacteroidales bacterium]|nr:gliding motility-associated C-terminal domain-containing protein [Bacteroidales bacterium]